jgi:hypothetical protein
MPAGGGVAGILTNTDFGNATTTNTGAVNVGGNFAAGIVTQVFDIGNATATNQGSVFAAAEYTATTDSSNTITGKAGLRYGF